MNGTLNELGGTIRQMPNSSASARMEAMYRRGSANSSSVGWYTGASFSALRRYFLPMARAGLADLGRLRCFFPVGPGGYYASCAPVLCVARACARRPRSNLSRVCAARARLRPGSPRSPSDRTDPRAVAPSPMPVRRCPAGRARVYNRFGLGRMLGRQKNTTKHRQTVRFQPKDAGKTRNGGLFLSRTKFNAEASRMVQTAPAPAEISDGGPGPGALQPAHGWRHVPALRR